MNDEKEQSSTGVGPIGEGREENADGGREDQEAGGAGCASQEEVGEKKRGVMVGMRVGRLTVIRYAGVINSNASWLCRCDCGVEKPASQYHLRKGNVKSCGCLRREACGNNFKTHGLTETPEYKTWTGIKDRCTNPKTPCFIRYGGKGIKVSDRWINSFDNFLSDMGTKPSPKHSIDRIDNNGNYEPGNCRWATTREQAENTSANVWVSIEGKEMILARAIPVVGRSSSVLSAAVAKAKGRGISVFELNGKTITILQSANKHRH